MKILFAYLTSGYRGGVKFQVDFASHFARSQVGFLTSNTTIDYEDNITKIGQIHRIPPTKQLTARFKALQKLSKQYDVLYINKATLNPIELFLCKRAGFRLVVYHSHSTNKDCKNPVIKLCYHALHYASLPFVKYACDFMYACSIPAGLWLYGKANKSRFRIINNGIEVERFRFNPVSRERLRGELNLHGFTVLHVGAFSAVKNQGYLISAFAEFVKKHPDASLLLVGKGEFEEECRQKAIDLGLEGSVRFLGFRSDVNELMSAADLFILPSTVEGLPFVAMEAQAAGLPCLISDVATQECKVTDICEFFSVKNPPSALADKMEQFVTVIRRDTADEVIKAGFDLSACAVNLENELENALNAK